MTIKLSTLPFVFALTMPVLVMGLAAAFAQSPTTAKGQVSTPTLNAQRSELNAQRSMPEQLKFYETQVKPILKAACYSCHDGANTSGQLMLSNRAAILKGGTSGPGATLDKPHASLILRAVNHDGRNMPPTGKLPQAQIDILTKWVEMGLPMPAEGQSGGSAPSVPIKHGPPPVNAETMKFWSFQPVKRPTVPSVKNKAWVTNPIDAFVLAKLEKNHLAPAPPAGKTTLLRRAYYDLTGLPPTSGEVSAFLADTSPHAYEKVVDKLLASPQYGEKWARHWLDLVRYGETNSFERDSPKPFVWRYRDYVIRALNEDKPYDRFIKEQLAGDELDQVTNDALIATGYYRLGAWDDEPSDPEQARYDELDDVVATTGQAFLGLTVNCARCHDHKLDPIPQKDYYRLLAFFQGTTRYGGGGRTPDMNSVRFLGTDEERRQAARDEAAYKHKLDVVNEQLSAVERPLFKDLAPVEKEEFRHKQARVAILQKRVPRLLAQEQVDQYASLSKQQDQLLASPPASMEKALCVTELPDVPQTCVLMRGNPHVKGDPVEPGFLSVLAPPQPAIHKPASNLESSGRRLALANWIASPGNPLTARVMVNRVWQHHFGRGIVRSANNFGFLGDKPTHPELLDWMASEFVNKGWKLKPLHKMIMMSSAYRMASAPNPHAIAIDPTNDLLWRFDMRRLDAEEVRDSILAVNGSLNPKMFGRSIYPTIPPEVLAGQSRPGADWETSTPQDRARRSIYIHIKRSLTVPILASFDAADTDFTCPVRFATTQPTQALGMLNSTFVNEQAAIFAETVKKQAGNDPNAQVSLALRRVMQREPTATEVSRGVKFLQTMQQKQNYRMDDALRAFCIIALNLNEFVYLD